MQVLKHHQIKQIAQSVQSGGVIVYPTDTIWGLGCHGLDTQAVQKLRQVKQKTDPLIWLLPSVKAVQKFCGELQPAEIKLLNQKHTTVIVHGQAVRVVKNGWLNKLLTACQVPLVGTSANLHGEKVVQSWRQAVRVLGDKVDIIVKGRRIFRDCPSQLVQWQDGQTKILRPRPRISIR